LKNMRLRPSTIRVCAVALSALCASVAAAQDKPPTPPPPRPQEEQPPSPMKPPEDGETPKEVVAPDPTAPDFLGFSFGDDTSQQIVGDERLLAATGNRWQPLWIKLPGFELRCESVVMWGDRDRLLDAVNRRRETLSTKNPETILGPLVHAVYAEGAVYARMNEQVIRADRVFLDFVRGQAYLVRAELKAKSEGRGRVRSIPLTVRAEVIRATSRHAYQADNAQISTCSYADPHFAFTTSTVDVTYDDQGWATLETAWWPTVRAQTILGDDTPIFVLPKIGGNSGLAEVPIQSVAFSHGSRMGTSVLTTWGGDIRREDHTRWGEWRLHLDERTARGPGAGVDVSHRAEPSRPGGPHDEYEFSGYWQRDDSGTDTFSDRAFDGGTDPKTNRLNRGFAHFFGRTFVEDPSVTDVVGTGWRVDSEISYYSDRGYFPEFDRAKAETEKEQETYVQALKTWGNQGVSVFASYRLNNQAAALDKAPGDLLLTNYENQTQYGPSATYHLINQPILGSDATGLFPLNLSVQASVANVERRFDDRLANEIHDAIGWRGEWVRRGDLETRMTTPFSVGDVHFNPSFGGSIYGVDDANGFDRQKDGGDARWSGFYGMRGDTQAWRTFPDAKSDCLDLDGLRHVASLDAQYFDRYQVSDKTGSYQANDPIDQLQEERIGSVRLRNRLQTKRDGDVVDWLDVESRFLYFFDKAKATPNDAFGVREDFAEPLQNLDFPGESKYTSRERDGSAFWQHRARLEFLRNLWLVGEADYDMQRSAFETSAAGVRWAASNRASFYVGRRTIHSDSTIWTERMDYRLSNRWGVEVEYQQDTKDNNHLNTNLSLFRRAHDYTLAVEFKSDSQSNDRAFWFAIYPNDWTGGRTDPFSLRRPLDYDALKWYR
jgi:hypothetical protein